MNNLYTIVGTDKLLLDRKISEILTNYKDKDIERTNIDLTDNSIITLLNELNTVPFLEDFRLVVLTNATFIKENKSYDKRLVDSFISFIKKPLETTILITVISEELKSDIYNTIKEASVFYKLDTIDTSNLEPFIKSLFENDGFKINNSAILELIARVDKDVNRILVEIEKLKLYKCDQKTVSIDDVKLLVNKDLDDNIYNLVNAVLEKNIVVAYQIYEDLMTLNEDETRIIASLIAKFNEMYQTRELMDSGLSKEEIASVFNVKSGRAFYMMKNARGIRASDIKKNMNKLLDLDYKIKTGLIDKNVGLELYILSIN